MSTETKPKTSTVCVVSEELSTFIDRMAEEIVLNNDIPTCSMCAIGDCFQLVNGKARRTQK